MVCIHCYGKVVPLGFSERISIRDPSTSANDIAVGTNYETGHVLFFFFSCIVYN
jgi:hypothetical protein